MKSRHFARPTSTPSTPSTFACKALRATLLTHVLLLVTWPGWAQVEDNQPDCLSCHAETHAALVVHAELPCADCHEVSGPPPDEELGHRESVSNETCEACHSRDARTVGRSVHDEDMSCESCHGTAHEVAVAESFESLVSPTHQIKTCGRCHDDVMDGYLSSEHARALLVSGLVSAPACTDCHGSGHRIKGGEADGAATSFAEVPKTCGECHAGILRTWEAESAHGAAWADEDPNAPVCTTCHSSHGIARATDRETHLNFPDQCGSCHEALYATYQDEFHGQVSSLGFEESAICSDCHTPHASLPASDPNSSIHPDNLAATCGSCHGETTAAFLTFDPHSDPTDPERSPQVYWVWFFMTGLLLCVFGAFFAHDLLWLQRIIVAKLRGEHFVRPTGTGPHVRRFEGSHVWTHVTIVVSFLLLAATGLPIKFHDAPWAQDMIQILGGIELARLVHRIAAVVTFGYAAFHLFDVFRSAFIRGNRGVFWGPNSLVPQPHDAVDLFKNLRYFLYLGPKPEGRRWGYWEKFDYMAVFWGVPIIGLSGLMLWFPDFFTQFLPGWTLNAAHVVHSDEALLATGFIFVFHFFHAHLRPESFPMDPVVFTGRMPLERFKEERAEEYEALVESGELEARIVDAPTASELRTAYIFGTIGLVGGLVLAAAIFWALLDSFVS